jgi:hypothetical protein
MNQTNLLSYIQSSNIVDTSCNCTTSEFQQAQEWKNQIDNLQLSWQPSIFKYLPSFKGYCWRLCDIWFNIVPRTDNFAITYLEIGTLCGANLISVAKTYGSHPHSELYCIDPWIDNDEYNEYKCLQTSNMNNFISNVNEAGIVNKIKAYKDFSYRILPQFSDNYFDIIYIDGNHEPYAVMEDGVLSFRKCKQGGWIIFDDYVFTPEVTNIINTFLSLYSDKIRYHCILNGQCYLQKR